MSLLSIFQSRRILYHPLSPTDTQLCLFIFPRQQKQQCGKMKKEGFPEPWKSTLPHLGRQLVSVLQWMPMGRTLCRMSMTRTHWGCTGRARGPPSQKGWEQSPSPALHPATKAFCRLIWMTMGQKAEGTPCPSGISCGYGFVAMSCTSTGALNSPRARQNRPEDCGIIKRSGKFKERLPGKVIQIGTLDCVLNVNHL